MTGIVASAALILVRVLSDGNNVPEGDDQTAARQVLAAAMAEIAAESRGDYEQPPIRAANLPPETAVTVAAPGAVSRPLPPDGYSFAEYHGEMAKGRMPSHAPDLAPTVVDPEAWPGSTLSMDALKNQATSAPRDWSYGWIQLAGNAQVDHVAPTLERLGVGILGASGLLVRAQLPNDASPLKALIALPGVQAVGAVPPEAKSPPSFAEEARGLPPNEPMPVFVTLMDSDPDGRWRRALEAIGAEVGSFDPQIRVYAATVTASMLPALAATDFVLSIEPIGIVKADHDSAVPAMGVDSLRSYQSSPGMFSGVNGAATPIGVMDTGLNVNHLDIASHRKSICGANFVHTFGRFEDYDLWVDSGLHGTHVTGTIAGNGYAQPEFAGMAPSVPHIRIAKVLTHAGWGTAKQILQGMDFLSGASACDGSAAVKPLIVNMSLSNRSLDFEGRSVAERKLDAIVWAYRQLYVVSQGNGAAASFSNYGAAKNSLSVGAVQDNGAIAWFSSEGGTADGRLAPQVVGTGVNLYSPRGDGAREGYGLLSGTSVAAPSVAGVAALLMDRTPGYRERPALARSRLMASAIKPDALLLSRSTFPVDNSNGPGTFQKQYGLGKVSAHTSVLQRHRADGWVNGSLTARIAEGEYAFRDIVVPEGASRLDLVMTWDEPPADTIGSAVLNDLDLWLDQGGDCGEGACGEYASRSRHDSVEWVIVRNPAPGAWRAKIVPHRIFSGTPRPAMAWTIIRGSATPGVRIEADKTAVGTGEELTLTITADAYIAAGTRLHFGCRNVDDVRCDVALKEPAGSRLDGTSLSTGWARTEPFTYVLGDIPVGLSRKVTVVVDSVRSAADAILYVTANAWNASGASIAVALGNSEGDTSTQARIEAPANDDFAAAETLEGEGSRSVDLLRSTAEPAEPLFTIFERFNHTPPVGGSVWFNWTASASNVAWFNIVLEPRKSGGRSASAVNVDVYQGDRIASLTELKSSQAGAEFFAEEGETYRIRVSHRGNTGPLTLHYGQGRPANDDFAAAVVLEGTEGSIEGNNLGATLEPQESFGALAATVWYRWTAPQDGLWQFDLDDSHYVTAAFAGADIANLRLVSGIPSRNIQISATLGAEYRIVVAAKDAFAAGSSHTLTWASGADDNGPANDHFRNATELGAETSETNVGVSVNATVEPGEPAETGVRTAWWVWTAPGDGAFTFRLLIGAGHGENVVLDSVFTPLKMGVFTGETLEDLEGAGRTGPGVTAVETVVDAVQGQQFRISIGLPANTRGAFDERPREGLLRVGPTPTNDSQDSAEQLANAGGSVSASNQFATTEQGEPGGRYSHSSLWWTWQAPADGWHRFRVDREGSRLAVYRRGDDGSLVLVGTNRVEDETLPQSAEVVFEATAGTAYVIRLGVDSRIEEGGGFTLEWGEAETPLWLKFLSQLSTGGLDADGNPVELRNPDALAIHEGGDVLYLASELGLQTFGRDPDSGDLSFVQLLDGDYRRDVLLWDPHRTRLIVTGNRCGPSAFPTFVPDTDDPAKLESAAELTFTIDQASGGGCRVSGALMDPGGSYLYLLMVNGIMAFAFNETGESMRGIQFVQHSGEPLQAVMDSQGRHFYVATNNNLVTLTRSADTGLLTEASRDDTVRWTRAMGITNDDAHLFVVNEQGSAVHIYGLEDPSNPVKLQSARIGDGRFRYRQNCTVAPRHRIAAFDAVCGSRLFSMQWREADSELAVADIIDSGGPDRFGSHIPAFDNPNSMVTSPDGLHLYFSTDDQGILVFERIGNDLADADSSNGMDSVARHEQPDPP